MILELEKLEPLCSIPSQLKKLEQLKKKFSPQSQASLDKFWFLMFDFFIAENEKAMRMCFSILESDKFLWDGAKNVAPWLISGLSLRYFTTEAEQPSIHKRLIDRYLKDSESHIAEKNIANALSPETLEEPKKAYTSKDNTAKEKYEFGVMLLGDYLRAFALRGANLDPADRFLPEAQQLIGELRELYKKINKIK